MSTKTHSTFKIYSSISCSGNGSKCDSGNTHVKISDGIVSITINKVTQKYIGTKCKIKNGQIKVDGVEQSHVEMK